MKTIKTKDEVDELDAAIPVYTLNSSDTEPTGERKNDYFVHENVIKAEYDELADNEKMHAPYSVQEKMSGRLHRGAVRNVLQ